MLNRDIFNDLSIIYPLDEDDHDSVDEAVEVETYEPKDSPMKRLANVINTLETIIWDYLQVEFKDAYHAGRRRDNSRNLDAALNALVIERDSYIQSWRWFFYKGFATYEAYHRLDDIARLVSYHKYLNKKLNQVKTIIKDIRAEKVDWNDNGISDIMLNKYQCEKITNALVQLLKNMYETLKWKVEHNICDIKDDQEHEYKIPKGETVKYHIQGMLGDYSGNSRFANEIKSRLLNDIHIVLNTLPAAMEGYLMPKFKRVIAERVEAADNVKKAVEPIKKDNQAKDAEIKEKNTLIEKQDERIRQYQLDQEKVLQSISQMHDTMFAQSRELHQLKLDVELLRNNSRK